MVVSGVCRVRRAPASVETSPPIRVFVTPQGGRVRLRNALRTDPHIEMQDLPSTLGLHPVDKLIS